MSKDRCPFCHFRKSIHQPSKAFNEYECGTSEYIPDGEYKRSPECYEEELEDKNNQLTALQSVCAEAYQLAGIAGAPEKALDNLAAAAAGEPIPHETFLPVREEDLELGERLKKLLRLTETA